MLLAGRVAEEMVFGDVSTGAENDLQRATEMARHMVTHYGMSEHLGLATWDAQPTPMYLGGPALPPQRNCSEDTAQRIDQEVMRVLADAGERVRATLTAQREALDALAGLLLEKEVVDSEMLQQVLRTAKRAEATA